MQMQLIEKVAEDERAPQPSSRFHAQWGLGNLNTYPLQGSLPSARMRRRAHHTQTRKKISKPDSSPNPTWWVSWRYVSHFQFYFCCTGHRTETAFKGRMHNYSSLSLRALSPDPLSYLFPSPESYDDGHLSKSSISYNGHALDEYHDDRLQTRNSVQTKTLVNRVSPMSSPSIASIKENSRVAVKAIIKVCVRSSTFTHSSSYKISYVSAGAALSIPESYQQETGRDSLQYAPSK